MQWQHENLTQIACSVAALQPCCGIACTLQCFPFLAAAARRGSTNQRLLMHVWLLQGVFSTWAWDTGLQTAVAAAASDFTAAEDESAPEQSFSRRVSSGVSR